MTAGTNVKLSFEGLLPSTSYSAYASNYDGYDGFNFKDMALLSRAAGYHSELTSLVSLTPHSGGLTSEFSLPQADQFGA